MVYRIFVEKKQPHNIKAEKLLGELKIYLGQRGLKNIRIITRFDVEGVDEDDFKRAVFTIFADPAVDNVTGELPEAYQDSAVFAIELLPGQYDQYADIAALGLQIFTGGEKPKVRCAEIYILEGECEPQKIKDYLINKVESKEAPLDAFDSLEQEYAAPGPVAVLENFNELNEEELAEFLVEYSLAMDLDDILFCQNYFKNTENRAPTITEIKMLDAYWSDHCRHTTFNTEITDVEIWEPCVKDAFEDYLNLRGEVYSAKNKKPVTLMDIATIGAKYLKKQGLLGGLDESEEVNACSVNIKADIDGKEEDYLLMFKNETHNHPTEIEPFGGASTCLGGAVRDPLSGRSYVYQAMRVTGAADPRNTETLKNKLPQHKITRTAADGYSSYGNQAGVAAGGIYEIYHPGYTAKRMELGAVIGAAPKNNVRRAVPAAGDAVILVGGRTGRDGIGGAAGSSKSHTRESLSTSGAEVQKGDAFGGRKLQRLFKKPHVARMIKRCNDFGAGGVSVAVGELADSILIDLSLVPAKYPGLDGTELAISESQERMAVVVSEGDCEKFIYEAGLENLEASKIASVTDDGRLRMLYDGNQILSLTRAFLNSNGAPKKTRAVVTGKKHEDIQDIFNIIYKRVKNEDIKQAYENLLSDINICAQKGLIEQFDSSAGGSAVISPLGGEQRLSPAQFMAAKIPADGGSEVRTASLMAYGFSPYISEISPYRGALYAVVESVSKLVAAGVNTDDIYLSFQEYFPRIAGDPSRFGLPFEALLGALKAQVNLELAAIGGKDSMSGTYTNEEDGVSIDVPPTLVSFAAGTANPVEIVSNEFKKAGSYVYLLKPLYDENNIIDFKDLKNLYAYLTKLIGEGRILSSYALGFGGIGEAVFKLCAGNAVGFAFDGLISQQELFASYYGAFIVESSSELPLGELLGKTTADAEININKTSLNLNKLTYRWLNTLEDIFPTGLNGINEKIKIEVPKPDYHIRPAQSGSIYKSAKPRVLIAALPGTNGEYETADRFEKAGALTETFIFRSLTPQAAAESFDELAKKINESQILVFPAGYSGGIVSSSVFTAAICARPAVRDAVRELLFVKDGLILGLGSGFAALVRLGLLPYGDFKNEADDFPSVTIGPNIIGRHNSFVTYTRISSVKSVWFAGLAAGDIHAVPVSHGEGRFYAAEDMLANLVHNGQIAAQYCDINGEAVMHPYFNPSGSDMAVEALFSPDGRILGKMGNSERAGRNVLKNVPGKTEQFIFSSGVKYFR